MRYECRDDVLDCRGHQRTIKTLAWWCVGCGEGVLEGAALADSERAYFELMAEVDRTLDQPEVMRVRETPLVMQYPAG